MSCKNISMAGNLNPQIPDALPIKRRMKPHGMEIYNFNTKRWVLERGQSATKYLGENGGVKYGDRDVKAAAPYKKGNVRTTRGWTIVKFTRDDSTTVKKMVNAILKEVKPGRDNIFVDLRYVEPSGESIIRSTKLIDVNGRKLTDKEFFDKLTHRVDVEGMSFGSDTVIHTYHIDTEFFRLKYKQLAGGAAHDKYTTIRTEYYKARSYKCDEGDCLLAIIRKNKVPLSSIRKQLELEDGPVDISKIEDIEKYFEININILEDSILTHKICKDTNKKNVTIVTYEKVYLYKSKCDYDSEPYEILLKDNHYSLIVEAYEIQFDRVCGVQLKKNDKYKYVQLSRDDQIKSLMKQNRPIAGVKNDKRKKIRKFLFFDIETIFNPMHNDLLETYSVAWWVHEDDERGWPVFKERNINKYLEQSHIAFGSDAMDQFINWIEDNDEDDDTITNFVLIGYNNSRFDNFPLLSGLIKADMFTNMLFVQNSILKMTFFNRHTTFDLCRFTMCKLSDACRDFNTYPKKIEGFSHYEPQNAFMVDRWDGLNSWIEENKKLLTKYNKYDVLSTANLFFIVRAAYGEIIDCDILDYTTLASASYARFIETKQFTIPAPLHEVVDKFLRVGLTGGRCQKFIVNYRKNEELFCVDVKSLYPYIMMNRVFPIGYYKITSAYHPEKLGFYYTKILKQPKKKIIPFRTEDGSLDWEYDGEFYHFLTSVEIECIRRHNGKVDVIPINDPDVAKVFLAELNEDEKNYDYEVDKVMGMVGIFWPQDTKQLFSEYFGLLSKMKTEQDIYRENKDPRYNPALRNILKLLLNSLSGKMVQRNFSTTTQMIKNNEEEKQLREKSKEGTLEMIYACDDYILVKGELKDELVYKDKYAKPSYLGVFIYAHSRTYMYDMLYSKYDVLYTDTDSAIMKKKDYEDFSSKFIVRKQGRGSNEYYVPEVKGEITTIGGDFGQFEEEFCPDNKKFETYILGKKVYCVEMTINGKIDGKSKYRMKGVNLGSDCMITKEEAELIDNMPRDEKGTKELYEKYKTCLANKDPLKIAPFRELNKTGECYFFCSRLVKKELKMQQTFTTKKISFDKETGEFNIEM